MVTDEMVEKAARIIDPTAFAPLAGGDKWRIINTHGQREGAKTKARAALEAALSAAEPVQTTTDGHNRLQAVDNIKPVAWVYAADLEKGDGCFGNAKGEVCMSRDGEWINVDTPLYAAPPAPSVAVKSAWAAKAAVLRSRGKNNTLHDINQAADYLDAAALSAQVQNVAQNGLTLSALQSAHVERQEEWCPDVKPDLSFRGNELGGECGEAQNVIKKLERERHGWRGSRDTVEHLAEELADVIHCSVLVAITAGVDLQQAVIAKFNDTSMKNGLSAMLPAAPSKQEG